MLLPLVELLASVLISALAAAASPLLNRYLGPSVAKKILKQFGVDTKADRTAVGAYSERVLDLTEKLTGITSEMDRVIAEMTEVVHKQEERRQLLLEEVTNLSRQEVETKARLEEMSKEDIVGMLLAQERRHVVERKADERHDYMLFLLGVVVTTIFTIIAALVAVATHHLGLT